MSELYGRSIEVYAYDPVDGAREVHNFGKFTCLIYLQKLKAENLSLILL